MEGRLKDGRKVWIWYPDQCKLCGGFQFRCTNEPCDKEKTQRLIDRTVASKPATSVVGRIATDEPRRGLCKNKDLNNFGVSENTTGKGVSPDGSHSKTGGGTPSGGSGDGYEASYSAPSKNPMTSVVGVRQGRQIRGDTKTYRQQVHGKGCRGHTAVCDEIPRGDNENT